KARRRWGLRESRLPKRRPMWSRPLRRSLNSSSGQVVLMVTKKGISAADSISARSLVKRLAVGVAVLAFVVGSVRPAHASSVVINGSFETGNFTGWTPVGDQTFNGVQ